MEGQEPELLPVSCGYFNQIVHQLLLKQRKLILKYILLDTKGMIFDRLLKYLQHHSLTELLIELMKLNLRFDGVMWNKTSESKWSDEEDEKESSPAKNEEESKSPEQTMMLKKLDEKKLFVVQELIEQLSHKNSDIERSLNASAVLMELVKYEKTRSIFFEDESKMIGQMIELAIDPSNGANQQYLL